MDTLCFEIIVQETQKNKNFSQKYLQTLYDYNMNFTSPVKSSGPLTSIKCFYPLPSRLLLSELYTENNKILKYKNEYQFYGEHGNRIIFADKILPFINNKSKYPIPFSFPIPSESDVEILLSNVYYYEVTLLNKQNINSYTGECISIGFGHKYTNFSNHVGWSNDSIGFHSDDGTIRYNQTGHSIKPHSNIWKPNDVIGAGVIYVNKNEIKPFFTINGKLIYMMGKTIKMKFPYFPMIGYDHSHSFETNFSTKPFVYNIKKIIVNNSNNIISSENNFICEYDIGDILNEPPNLFLENNSINNDPVIMVPLDHLNNLPIIVSDNLSQKIDLLQHNINSYTYDNNLKNHELLFKNVLQKYNLPNYSWNSLIFEGEELFKFNMNLLSSDSIMKILNSDNEIADDENADDENADDEFADDENADDEIADDEFADDEITDDEFADDEITDDEFADDEITDDEIADDEIADDEIADDEIADDEIADDKIADDEIADDEIADDEIPDDKIVDHGNLLQIIIPIVMISIIIIPLYLFLLKM